MSLARFIPDKLFLKFLFRNRMGYWMDFKSPRTFNEKLQWLKVYDRKTVYTNFVDKIEVKKFVADKIGKEYIIPTLYEYNNVDEINWETLPNQFVLKCTHDSGGVIVCTDKSKLDIEQAIRTLRKNLSLSYYIYNREYPYKNCKRRIICEELLVDESGYELKDYKFFCFNGVPKLLFVASDRFKDNEETKFDFFDLEFNRLPFTNGHPQSSLSINKPIGFEKMIEISKILSNGLPHVRVDLYNINGRIYFGEMTFYHWSGLVPFEPKEWDYKIGDMLKLPGIDY